ncbi:MAG TPA: tripartite tricarboxylate transporter permease [Candidatus Nanoarchaeia archaeon]|nr:tripartite tricarboxylate transporter permease [Candidatus Nanoarchaeia archaeon]
MILEIFLSLILGLVCGTITGLLPGIHINLVITFLLGLTFTNSLSLPLAIFIIALSFTHILIDFIPTTLLGVPTEENYLSAQPAHRLVMQGKANQAINVAFLGVLMSIPLIIVLSPIYAFVLPSLFEFLQEIIPYLILLMSLYLIFQEDNIISGILIFLLSGILGFFAFDLPVKEPLLPLLSGLFGLSAIFSSMFYNSTIPKQETTKTKIKLTRFLRPLSASFFISPILSFFPGIGAGHISLFSAQIINPSSKQFIFLNSISSSLNMALSIIAAYSIQKTRTGTSAAILHLLSPISINILCILILSIIISIIFAYKLGKLICIPLISIYNKISYGKISLITAIFVILVNTFFTNSLGLIILASGTLIGLICQKIGVRKIQMMGALLLSTLLYYFL